MKIYLHKTFRMMILSLTLILVLVSIFLSFDVKANYDMSLYLPEDSKTLESINVLEDTFGNHAQVELMIKDQTISDSLAIKETLLSLDQIINVVWMDNFVDVSTPSHIPETIKKDYYQEGHARMILVFQSDMYDKAVEETIEDIKGLLSEEDIYFRGQAVDQIASRDISEQETIKIFMIILPLCLLILVFASRSWIEPLIILLTLGIGVLLNMGTNVFLPNVSFITLTIAAALQLAISLDYSLFYMHRYYEYVDEGDHPKQAIIKAFKRALPVISASALTTIIGFIALFFMRYRIGFDIGLVLSKGIILSYVSVICVLPVLILSLHPLIEKFRHRHFMFNLSVFTKIFDRWRYGFLILFASVLTLGIIFQSQSSYLFGNASFSGDASQVSRDKKEIALYYDAYQTITYILKDSTQTQELSLIHAFKQEKLVVSIDALYTQVPEQTPLALIPDQIKGNYIKDNYTRMTVYLSLVEESQEAFALNDRLNDIVQANYQEFYVLGDLPSTADIRQTVLEDTPIVLMVSIGLIFIILLAVFKNILMAVLLILIIQAAIWFNVGLLAMSQREVIYIGYIVVLALQLGATIDYAVLFASRYKNFRMDLSPKHALKLTLKKASIPIMISGFVLAGAGFAEMLFSEIQVISDIGLLIGRGALLSLALVLFVLPSLLLIFDPWLIKHKGKHISE